jgi:hypothetical protein
VREVCWGGRDDLKRSWTNARRPGERVVLSEERSGYSKVVSWFLRLLRDVPKVLGTTR